MKNINDIFMDRLNNEALGMRPLDPEQCRLCCHKMQVNGLCEAYPEDKPLSIMLDKKICLHREESRNEKD